ncbi:hypothetical protein TNCT_250111 [Trichonephila clavata]|uniref:Ankyrin repeat protein n=1 Tax=Trichonephila clavata TaxID=2740835 RepID=A0A8X6KYB3_TRICU|nr:hypothetical protein TNCT_250111 [Trichonephila clavata]
MPLKSNVYAVGLKDYSELEYYPLPDGEPHIYWRETEFLVRCYLLDLNERKVYRYIQNIKNEGRSVHVAIINYNNPNDPALDIVVDNNASDISVSYREKTALHHAALSCNPEFISKLVEHNADPARRDTIGRTPLHYLLNYCDVRVIETLKEKLEIDEHSSDSDEPSCDVPLHVIKFVDDLFYKSIPIHNIITSAKILIKYSMLRDAVMYKNWCKMRKVELLPEILNYLKLCISEVHSMKAKKITHYSQLYTLVTARFYGKSYKCSPKSTRVIIKHMVNVSNKKGYHIYHADVAKIVDRVSLINHLMECAIYARSECGKRKPFLNPYSISILCKNLSNNDVLNLIIAVSVLNENRSLYS